MKLFVLIFFCLKRVIRLNGKRVITQQCVVECRFSCLYNIMFITLYHHRIPEDHKHDARLIQSYFKTVGHVKCI